MDELVKKLQETVGLSAEQATSAAECVKDYIKDKTPTIIANKFDDIFDGKKVEFGDILREKANEFAGNGKDALNEMADFMDNLAGKATRKTEDIVNKFSDFVKRNTDK